MKWNTKEAWERDINYIFWIIIKHSKKIRIKVKIFSIHCNKNRNKTKKKIWKIQHNNYLLYLKITVPWLYRCFKLFDNSTTFPLLNMLRKPDSELSFVETPLTELAVENVWGMFCGLWWGMFCKLISGTLSVICWLLFWLLFWWLFWLFWLLLLFWLSLFDVWNNKLLILSISKFEPVIILFDSKGNKGRVEW